MQPLRAGRRVGKYLLEKRLAEGGFALVYRALDTVEGVRVALKIPLEATPQGVPESALAEVRLMGRLQHENVLPIKNADVIEGRLVMAFPLGECTLADRLEHRISTRQALEFVEQISSAVAHVHRHRIIHRDLKPENFILFPEGVLRLADFGIAREFLGTGTTAMLGTAGYMAPEQRHGHATFRSDVFALGLIIHQLLTGHLPEPPFTWPSAGQERLRHAVHKDLIAWLRKALQEDPTRRHRDAVAMVNAYRKLGRTAVAARRPHRTTIPTDWRLIRRRQFQRLHRRKLGTEFECARCGEPVSEAMLHCPWCGEGRPSHDGLTRFPSRCPECYRGLKLDWRHCPWCRGSGLSVAVSRHYSDRRYSARCDGPRCDRRVLMPFMRYCPWCRRKVARPWPVDGATKSCPSCDWGILDSFWEHCPWCGKGLEAAT